ncbi:helix-turn-helix domain-containing protein [Candidatus Bipolaricaulota bacterium]|nr:helix-turn-helix domain-containing protein [Candidatus Bipolaricaulota bacterium]
MKTFGIRLKEMRKAANLTQQQVAERTGVSNTYISALESGRKQAPPRAIVTALAACLGAEETALWNLARSEREDRLRERINGVPTSRHVPRSENSASQACTDTPLPPEFDRAMQSLHDVTGNRQQRLSLAKALEAIAAALREKA